MSRTPPPRRPKRTPAPHGLTVHEVTALHRIERLTHREVSGPLEHDLVWYVQQGGEVGNLAAEVLLRAHSRSIKLWAMRNSRIVQGHDIPLCDLVTEAQLGFLHAARKYDPTRGVQLVTYAIHWMRHQVTRTCVNEGFTVRVPVYRADQPLPIVARVRKLARLDAPVFVDGTPSSVLERVPAQGPSPEDEAVARLRAERVHVAVKAAMRRLTPQERHVIRRRRLSRDEPTLEAVGRELSLSKERVRQLEDRAMWKLRRALDGHRAHLGVSAPPSEAVRAPARYKRRKSVEQGPHP